MTKEHIKNYRKKHESQIRQSQYQSYTKNYITKYATMKDLHNIKKLVQQRQKQL